MKWREFWEKVRQIIDNEEEDKIPKIIEETQKNKSESEIFLQKLLNAVEEKLKREITRIQNTDKAYIPEKFVLFLSAEADKELSKEKRDFFEKGLSKILLERAEDMAGNLELTSKEINVQIKVNGVLKNEEVEVKILSKDEKNTGNANEPNNNKNTIEDIDSISDILYYIEIWQADKKLNEFPIIRKQNTIGRDDEEGAANLRLPTENRRISRIHAEIISEENGEIWVTSLHKNPTVVSGKAIKNGERAQLDADGEIQIYDFLLKLKFKK